MFTSVECLHFTPTPRSVGGLSSRVLEESGVRSVDDVLVGMTQPNNLSSLRRNSLLCPQGLSKGHRNWRTSDLTEKEVDSKIVILFRHTQVLKEIRRASLYTDSMVYRPYFPRIEFRESTFDQFSLSVPIFDSLFQSYMKLELKEVIDCSQTMYVSWYGLFFFYTFGSSGGKLRFRIFQQEQFSFVLLKFMSI